MNKNYKGFSLAELLVTIAVFSIVMIGIFSIMNNTLRSYGKNTYEVATQEDAQIVANQIEELLCDVDTGSSLGYAEDIDGGSGAYNYKTYTFKSEGKNYTLQCDFPNHKLTLTDGTATTTLAENVVDFGIDSWNSGKDNAARVNMTIDNKGARYVVNKEVYFRNNIEYSDFNSIDYMVDTATPSPGPSGEYTDTLHVLRYETVNLTTKYGIRYGGTLTNGSSLFDFDDSTLDSLTDADDDYVYTIKANDTLNMGMSTSVTATDAVVFSGYKESGAGATLYKILIVVDPVEICKIDDSSTKTGVHQNADSRTSNNGYHTYVKVKGININQAVKSGIVANYDIDFKDGTTTKGSCSSIGIAYNGTTKINDGAGDATQINLSDGGRIHLGVVADPNSGGLIIVTGNPGVSSTDASYLNGKKTLNFDLTLKLYNSSVSEANKKFEKTYNYDFRVYGTDLN